MPVVPARSERRAGGRPLHRFGFPLAAAAAVLLVLVLRPPSDEGVAGLARVDPVRWVPTSTPGTGPSRAARLFEDGMRSYVDGRWAEAAARLESALEAEAGDWDGIDRARFYLGLSLLLDGRAADALPPLERASGSPRRAISDRAKWYRAQAHLLLEDADAARALLDELSRDSPGYARPASRQLLALQGR